MAYEVLPLNIRPCPPVRTFSTRSEAVAEARRIKLQHPSALVQINENGRPILNATEVRSLVMGQQSEDRRLVG